MQVKICFMAIGITVAKFDSLFMKTLLLLFFLQTTFLINYKPHAAQIF